MSRTHSKGATLAVAFPLALAFFVRDCARENGGAGRAAKGGANQQASVNANRRAAGAGGEMGETQAGAWGGEHISLELTAEGATVEYDCAHGTIDEPVKTDAGGRFEARGTHVREHGGPVRRDEKPDTHPARYAGRIKGDTMTLAVTETDTGEIVGTFTLARGAQPQLMKCR